MENLDKNEKTQGTGIPEEEDVTNVEIDKLQEQMSELNELKDMLSFTKKKSEGVKSSYKFWDTQPVPGFKDNKFNNKIGPIDENTDLDKVKDDPYKLPTGFSWVDVDIFNKKDLTTVSHQSS
jgi:glycylpeptide N-tetradecanoyltransferase